MIYLIIASNIRFSLAHNTDKKGENANTQYAQIELIKYKFCVSLQSPLGAYILHDIQFTLSGPAVRQGLNMVF